MGIQFKTWETLTRTISLANRFPGLGHHQNPCTPALKPPTYSGVRGVFDDIIIWTRYCLNSRIQDHASNMPLIWEIQIQIIVIVEEFKNKIKMRRLKEIKRKYAQFWLTRTGDAKHKINSFRPKLSPPFYYLLKPGSNTEMKLQWKWKYLHFYF